MKACQPCMGGSETRPYGLTRRASAKERKWAALIASLVVLLFITLWALQKASFDFGLLFNPCGFYIRTGWPCPGCYMTRSVLAFARGQVGLSFYLQPAAGIACLVLVVVAFLTSLIAVTGVYFRSLDRFFKEVKLSHLVVGVLVVISAGWAVTLARAFAEKNTGR